MLKKLSGSTGFAVKFIVFAAAVWALAANALLRMPLADIARFLLFQLLCVVLPGMALHKLFGMKTTPLESLVYSYGFGFAAVVAVYFCFAPFGLCAYIPYGMLALAAAAAAVLWCKRTQPLSGKADDGELRRALVFAAVGMLFTFVLLSMSNLNPALAGTRAYYHDTVNGVGLTVAASRGFPMRTMQMAGWVFPYHIFFYSYTACMYLATGIAAFELVMNCTLITLAPLCIAAFAALLAHVCKSRPLQNAACFIFVCVPSFGNVHNLYNDTIAFPVGTAFGVLSVLAFLQAQKQSSGINRLHLIAMLMLCMATGAKGPVAVSYLFGICFVLLIELIREKNLMVFPKGLLYAVSFFALYVLLYRGGAGDSMTIRPLLNAASTDVAQLLASFLPLGAANAVGAVWFALSRCFAVSAAIAFLAVLAVRRKPREPLFWFCFGTMLEASVLINLFVQMGSSEIYFLSGVYPIMLAAVFAGMELAWGDNARMKHAAAAAFLLLCVLLNGNAAVTTVVGERGIDSAYPTGIRGALAYSALGQSEQVPAERRVMCVSPAEYEAYLWLRDNTPADAVIANYRYTLYNKYFCGSAFSERAFYLEGWGYVTMEDSNGNTPEKVRRDSFLRSMHDYRMESMLPVLAQEGVDYYMMERCVIPDWEFGEQFCTEVFRNEDVVIYKLSEVVWN